MDVKGHWHEQHCLGYVWIEANVQKIAINKITKSEETPEVGRKPGEYVTNPV
jgi:hypothetical protein